MKKIFSRRHFFLWASALGVGFLLFRWKIFKKTANESLESAVQQTLDYVEIPPDALKAFAQDALRHNPFASNYLSIEAKNQLAAKFLMSTNFFRRKNGESLRYIAYYNPSIAPCQNPFAEFNNNG
ncbi:MAG TPA: hypothetical protein PKD37_01235 [Oligoflexia bacterium]|nr:hypothetical protein [Oligoflexia bacterium]HMP26599.1 hypothetical protein [Oligoflexia bacterium]